MEYLKEIANKINKRFHVDIRSKSRKQDVVFARKVFCKITRDLLYSYEVIGNEINTTHATAVYHANTVDLCLKEHSNYYKQLRYEYGLDEIGVYKEMVEEIETYKFHQLNERYRELLIMLDILSEEDLKRFIESRAKPFINVIRSEVRPKKIKEVKGAAIIRN
jgi:hypothetical protein